VRFNLDHAFMHPRDEEQDMTNARSASRWITDEVASWPGVSAGHGRRGEFAFKIGPREIGHLHGDHAAHLSFPKHVWQRLYEEGRVDYHPVFPGKPGHASRRIENEDDVRDVIVMIRMNYDRIVERFGLPAERDEELASA
jgi:Family of unknown function (DUF5519)